MCMENQFSNEWNHLRHKKYGLAMSSSLAEGQEVISDLLYYVITYQYVCMHHFPLLSEMYK